MIAPGAGWIAFALCVWTAFAVLAVRRAQLRATGDAAVSWLALGGAACVGALAIALRPLPEAAACGIACIALVVAGDADARTGYLFDAITIPAALIVLAVAFCTGMGVRAALGCGILVAAFGAIVLLSRGRAMGLGDVKAMASIGAAFGPTESMLAIAAACASGIVEAALRGRLQRRAEIRFGPHLAVGSAFALVAGGPLTRYFIGG